MSVSLRRVLPVLALLAASAVSTWRAVATAAPGNDPDTRDWIQLFNGKDLAGWTPKFAKYALGENPYDTVRVENGLLEIRYDKWPTFDNQFGHVFYKDPFSYYILAAEYRFVGEQVKGGPGWARRNNGLMLHSPSPETMLKDQDFPISLETQLLGGLGDGKPRTTANLCTPGTNVVMRGSFAPSTASTPRRRPTTETSGCASRSSSTATNWCRTSWTARSCSSTRGRRSAVGMQRPSTQR
jgi:hypothetical protein